MDTKKQFILEKIKIEKEEKNLKKRSKKDSKKITIEVEGNIIL